MRVLVGGRAMGHQHVAGGSATGDGSACTAHHLTLDYRYDCVKALRVEHRKCCVIQSEGE